MRGRRAGDVARIGTGRRRRAVGCGAGTRRHGRPARRPPGRRWPGMGKERLRSPSRLPLRSVVLGPGRPGARGIKPSRTRRWTLRGRATGSGGWRPAPRWFRVVMDSGRGLAGDGEGAGGWEGGTEDRSGQRTRIDGSVGEGHDHAVVLMAFRVTAFGRVQEGVERGKDHRRVEGEDEEEQSARHDTALPVRQALMGPELQNVCRMSSEGCAAQGESWLGPCVSRRSGRRGFGRPGGLTADGVGSVGR